MKTITVNGQEITLTDEQIAAIQSIFNESKQNPFEKVQNQEYYFINSCGEVQTAIDRLFIDNERYEVANYCINKDIMRQHALHETLNRLLWRYSQEHGGDNNWDTLSPHYFIFRSIETGTYKTGATYNSKRLQVYFANEKIAKAAIHDIVEPFIAKYPDFKW